MKHKKVSEILGTENYIFLAEYARTNYINEFVDPLILLYDKVLIKDKALLFDNPEKIDNFKTYSKNEWIVSISGFMAYVGMGVAADSKELKSFSKSTIAHDKILDLYTWFNVTKVLSTEFYKKLSNSYSKKDFLNLCENVVQNSDFPYDPNEVYQTFYQLLEFYFQDQIMVSQLNCTSMVQEHQKAISEVYFEHLVTNQSKDLNHDVEVLKAF